tara:strand:- start:46 stop:951 length:906 start_codon:yes stop_codon:yes gene_type:complete
MTEHQLNYFKTFSTGLIDSVLIKTKAKGYVTPCGSTYAAQELNCDWTWTNDNDDPDLDRVRRNNGGDKVANNSGYRNERSRIDGRITTPIDTFLRNWLETKDDTIFNTNPLRSNEEEDIDYTKEYSLPFKHASVTEMLIFFKWITMKAQLNSGMAKITQDDLLEVGCKFTLVDFSKLLKSFFDKSITRNWYDQETKTLEVKVGSRELKVAEGPGYIKFDMGPNQLEIIKLCGVNILSKEYQEAQTLLAETLTVNERIKRGDMTIGEEMDKFMNEELPAMLEESNRRLAEEKERRKTKEKTF